MRFLMIVVTVVLISAFLTGCVSTADKSRLVILEEKVIQYEKQAADVLAGVKDKTLTIAQAETLFNNIRNDTTIIADEIKILRDKGYSALEIILVIMEKAAVIAAGLGATYVWRGSVNKRKGKT